MVAITPLERHHLQKFIKSLKDKRARHTELISVLVPAGYELTKVIQQLSDEAGTATNIKSAGTRKNVIEALEKMIGHLRTIGKTPERGLAAYCGNVSEKEGGSDFVVTSIEPPMALNQRLYRCDKDFKLDALEEMCVDDVVYGLVVMDNREATIALLQGKKILPLVETHSSVPGKFRAGGQSAPRFQRIRENLSNEFQNKIAHLMMEQYLPLWGKLRGIIVGGPGIPKVQLMECAGMNQQIKSKVLALKDLSYTGEFGLEELVDLSSDVLASEDVAEEKKLMGTFFRLLREKEKQVTYGLEHTRRLLEMGIVQTVLASERLDDSVFDGLEELAKQAGSEVKIISTDTREGVQLRDLGGVAAILRYEYEG